MKWMQVQKILMTNGVKILAAMLGAGVIGTAAVQSRMDDNAFSPSGHSRAILQNEVVYPGEEERTRANGEGDGKDAWEKAEELLEEKLAQSDAADSALFDESRIAGRIEDANVLVSDFEDDLSDRKDRGTDRASKQTSHGQLDGRSVYVRDNNAQDGSPVIPALNRDRIVGRTGDNAADDGRTGNNGLTTGRNDSRRSTGTSETSNGGSEYSGYDRRQRSDNAEAAGTDDRTRVITPVLDPSKPVVKTPEEERIERLREEYKQYDFVIPESHPANIGYTTSISEKRLARMEAKEDAKGKKGAIVTISEVDYFNPRKFTTADVLDAATILYAYDVKLNYGTLYSESGFSWLKEKLTSYQIDNPDLENVKVAIEDGYDDHHKNVRVIVGYGPKVGDGNTPYDYAYQAESDEEFEIELFDERVIFVDEDGKEIGSRYYNDDDECLVYDTEMPMFAEGSSVETYFMEGDIQYVSKLFQGVSETPGGELIDRFKVGPEGRIDGKRVLYARESFDVPSNWRIQRSSFYEDEDDPDSKPIFFSILRSIDDTSKDIVIPSGVEEIDGDIKARTLTISKDVRKINLSKANVAKAFHVDEDNPYFTVSKNGLLIDKKGETLYGVPAEATTVVVPSDVKEIACNFADGQTVEFIGNEQPSWQDNQADMRENQSLKIVLPKDSYLEYLRKWRMDEAAMRNVYIEGEIASLADQKIFVEQDGAVVQRIEGSDKLQLLRIPDGIPFWGTYVVPDTVAEIKADAIPASETLGLLVVPESVEKIDESILHKDNVSSAIYLMNTDTAPEIVHDGVGSVSGNLSDIKVANNEVLQQLSGHISEKTVSLNKGEIRVYNGNVYSVQTEDKRPALILLRANPAARTFLEQNDVPEDCDLVMVDANAFANCKNLQLVELPESTTLISENAFKGCDNLEGVLAKTSDDLYIMPGIFDGCNNLRFFATNTACPYRWSDYGDCYFSDTYVEQLEDYSKAEEELVKYVTFLGDEDLSRMRRERDNLALLNILYANNYFSSSEKEPAMQYSLQSAGDGFILLAQPGNTGTESSEYASDIIVVASTTDISGELNLGGAHMIASQAFEGCKNSFTIAQEDWAVITEFMSEAFKNASGFKGVSVDGISTGHMTLGENGELYDENDVYLGRYLFVGEQAFANCTGIKSLDVTLGEVDYSRLSKPYEYWQLSDGNAPGMPMEAFAGCSNLTEVTFLQGENEAHHIDHIDFRVFADTGVTELTVPESVTSIVSQAFGNKLKKLDFSIPIIEVSDDDGENYEEYDFFSVPTLEKSSLNSGFGLAESEFAFKYSSEADSNDLEITFNGKTGEECLKIASAFIMQWRYNMLGYKSEVSFDRKTWTVYEQTAAESIYQDYYYNIYEQRDGKLLEELRAKYSNQPGGLKTAEGEDSSDQSEEARAEKLKNETISLIRTAIIDRVGQAETKLKKMMKVVSDLSKLDEEIGYISVTDEIDAAIEAQKAAEAMQDEEDDDLFPYNIDAIDSEDVSLEDSLMIDVSDTFDASEMLEEMKTSMATDTYLEEAESKDDEIQPKRAESELESESSEKVEAEESLSSDQPETDENIVEDEKSEIIESAPAEDDEVLIEEEADAAEAVEEITTDTVEDAELAEEITADDTELDAVADDSSDENLIETADEVTAEATDTEAVTESKKNEAVEVDAATHEAVPAVKEISTEVEASNESGETTEYVTAEETTTVEENSSDAEN